MLLTWARARLVLNFANNLFQERNQLLFFSASFFTVKERAQLSLNFVDPGLLLRSELFNQHIDSSFVFINVDNS